jgi:hypothetical protein
MFLPTASIGHTRKRFLGRECLTWAEVRELAQRACNLAPTRLTTPNWWNDPGRRFSGLAQSKTEIEQQLGRPVTDFCYPYAFPQCRRLFVARFRDLVRETGYARCVTTQLGRVRAGDDPYQLKRLPVNYGMTWPCSRPNLRGLRLAGPSAGGRQAGQSLPGHRSTPAGASAAPPLQILNPRIM